MGGIISRWKEKPSTVDLLEDLDKKIKDLVESQGKNQRMQKLWMGRLLVYSATLYLLSCFSIYFFYVPDNWSGWFFTTVPLIAFPAIVWFARKLLIFLFSKHTERNNDKLEDLKAVKRKMLEEVMETETYKNAKLILERFDPAPRIRVEEQATPVRPQMTPKPGQEVRQRHIAMASPGLTPRSPQHGATLLHTAPGGPPDSTHGAAGPSPAPSIGMETPPQMRRNMSPYSPLLGMGMHPPGPPMTRPIIPRERSAVDRVIEYLVGDGPQNRFALICQQCFSHNGMALKEEFEYLAFRCAYCYFMNPARKTRPQAPRLPDFSFERRLRSESPNPLSSAATNTPEDSGAHKDDADPAASADKLEPDVHEAAPTSDEVEDLPRPDECPAPCEDREA